MLDFKSLVGVVVPDHQAPADRQRQGLLFRMFVSLAVAVEAATRASTAARIQKILRKKSFVCMIGNILQ